MMDGDNTYDAYEIPMLIDPIVNGHADVCLGNRFARMEPGAMNARNRLGNRMITRVINGLYGLKLKDSQSGFRALRKSALDSLDLDEDGMPFASEMIIDARKKSLRIVEVPVTYRQRIGEPKLKAYKDGSLIIASSSAWCGTITRSPSFSPSARCLYSAPCSRADTWCTSGS